VTDNADDPPQKNQRNMRQVLNRPLSAAGKQVKPDAMHNRRRSRLDLPNQHRSAVGAIPDPSFAKYRIAAPSRMAEGREALKAVTCW
jgi:hypothetical protein